MVDDEGVVGRALAAAREWVWGCEEALAPAIDEYRGGDLWRDLLLRLRMAAVPEAHAALTLLSHPIESMAVDVLLRSLLEALAHAVWLVEGEAASDSTPRDACVGTDADGVSSVRRACCLEYGMAKQFATNVRKGSPSSVAESTPKSAEAWL